MTCLFDNLYLEFEQSGMKIQPINMDLRNNRKKDDWCQVKLTEQAAQYVKDNMVPFEAVNVHTPGGAVWRGWVRTDSVRVSENSGHLQMYDPLKILEQGVVEEEYLKTSIGNIANDIWDKVHDPENVLSGLQIDTDNSRVAYQHEASNMRNLGIGGNATLKIEDWMAENLPIADGKGDFDFRAESPRECFANIADAFNVGMYTQSNGNFVLGLPERVPNEYMAGTKNPYWKLTRYDLPEVDDPFGAVFVKGKKPRTGMIGGTINAVGEFLGSMDNTAPWAGARMSGYDGPPTAIEYKETSSKSQLESVARRYLRNQFDRYNSGTVSVDVLASKNQLQDMGPLKVGDALMIERDEDCGVPGGNFRINGIQHDMGSGKGWEVTFDVTAIYGREIGTESWDYNPLNEEMNKDDGGGFFLGALPIIALGAAYQAGKSILDYSASLERSIMDTTNNVLDASEQMVSDTIQEADDIVDDTVDAASDTLDDAGDAVDSFLP